MQAAMNTTKMALLFLSMIVLGATAHSAKIVGQCFLPMKCLASLQSLVRGQALVHVVGNVWVKKMQGFAASGPIHVNQPNRLH